MVVPTPRYNKKYKVTKLREPKVRKYVSDRVTPASLIKKRLMIDCGPAVALRDADQTDIKPQFTGYRFTQARTEQVPGNTVAPSDLTWNDGVFWAYTNNFCEPPLTFDQLNRTSNAGGTVTAVAEKPPTGTTTALIRNRQLFGGSMVLYSKDNGATAFEIANTKDPNVPQNHLDPFVCVTGTNQIHQYDQRVEFVEDMVYTQPLDGRSTAVGDDTGHFMYPSPIPPFGMGLNMINNTVDATGSRESRDYTVAQLKLMDCLQFAVRNIVLLVPANYPEDGEDTSDEFGRISGSKKKDILEKVVMKQLFQTSEGGCGPPSKKNEDLYRRVNPEFKVLRDWKQKYSFSGRGDPTTVRTKFYHRYNHAKSTMCRFETTLGEYIHTSTYSQKVNQEIPTDDNLQAEDMQDSYEEEPEDYPPTAVASITTAGDKRKAVDAFGDENANNPKYEATRKASGYDPTDYKVFNPQTHRIVWLRIPRFASTLELQDINKGTFLPTTFLNQKGVLHCIENCGTRMRGYAEWNILKPEITNTGGTTVPMTYDHSSGDQSYSHANLTNTD